MARRDGEYLQWYMDDLDPDELRERPDGDELTPRERRRLKEEMDELNRKEAERLRRFYLCPSRLRRTK